MLGGGVARVIPADGRSILGGAPTLAILDERAAWEREKGDNLENAILSGSRQARRPGADYQHVRSR